MTTKPRFCPSSILAVPRFVPGGRTTEVLCRGLNYRACARGKPASQSPGISQHCIPEFANTVTQNQTKSSRPEGRGFNPKEILMKQKTSSNHVFGFGILFCNHCSFLLSVKNARSAQHAMTSDAVTKPDDTRDIRFHDAYWVRHN